MSDTPAQQSDAFTSVYGKLMALGGRLSDDQMAALRELDGVLAMAEHVMRGTPVGAGAHSTICGYILNAYAAGRAAQREDDARLMEQHHAHYDCDPDYGTPAADLIRARNTT